jgi:lysophospholipase L1-like esterase
MIQFFKPLLVLLLLLPLTLQADSDIPANKTHIFILAGQSNMMGRGDTAQLPAHLKQPPENVEFYTHGRQSQLAKYQYFGPEVQFAHAMAKIFPKEKVIIIKSAASGSSIQEWMPKQALYQGLLRQVKFVSGSSHPKIEAIIWMQGETDARNETTASAYANNLSQLITHLRQDLQAENVPFLIGQINQKDPNFPMEKQVRTAQAHVANMNSHTLLVSNDGLSKIYDKVHYDAKGLVELGRRFAISFVNHRKQQLLAN